VGRIQPRLLAVFPVLWRGELATNDEQIVLNLNKSLSCTRGDFIMMYPTGSLISDGDNHSRERIKLIDISERADAFVRLMDPRATNETGLSSVTASCVDSVYSHHSLELYQ